MIRAHAKVNLFLRVRSRDATGLHPVCSLAQSIPWSDALLLATAEEDSFAVEGPLPAEEENLAWRAVTEVRRRAGAATPMSLRLTKLIPVAAGLGGGSADAAAGLEAAGRLFGMDEGSLRDLAPALGSDVPFCLVGGTALVSGSGDEVSSLPTPSGFALAVVVPPFELSTAEVFRRWDELGEPAGSGAEGRSLPPALREHAPLVNDLLPAARDLSPALGDWMSDLAALWDRPVLLTGSGPALFAFFSDADEAGDAVSSVAGHRGVWSGLPASRGWEWAEKDR